MQQAEELWLSMVNFKSENFEQQFSIFTSPSYISSKPSYFENFLIHLGLFANHYYKNYLLHRLSNNGYTEDIDWSKQTTGTIQRYTFNFELDPFGKLARYSFIGPFDILAQAGGLFTSLKLIVVLILGAATLKYYLNNVSKNLKNNFKTCERLK